jgi:hypothetical protein
MRTFFSGTDLGELSDNAEAHNFYLSFIVNNRFDTEAKVAVLGKVEKELPEEEILATDENGQPYCIGTQKFVISHKKLFIYDCEITQPEVSMTVNEEFREATKAIIDAAQLKLRNTPAVAHNRAFPMTPNGSYFKKETPAVNGSPSWGKHAASFWDDPSFSEGFSELPLLEEVEEDEDLEEEVAELFLTEWVGDTFEIVVTRNMELMHVLNHSKLSHIKYQVLENKLNKTFKENALYYVTDGFTQEQLIAASVGVLNEFKPNPIIRAIYSVFKKNNG